MVEVEGKRIFLSGPMSDDPTTYHVADFLIAHRRLNGMGAKYVYDPGFEFYCTVQRGKPAATHEQGMRRTLAELTYNGENRHKPLYDMVVLLPGWERSRGAIDEANVARACGIAVVELREVLGE